MSDDFLSGLGFHLQDLVAGFAGGVANAFVFKKSNPWAIIGSVVVGGFSANYLGSTVSQFLGTSSLTTGFIVGLTGMALCQGIIDSASSWKLFKGKENG
jgi:hypothetical protein